MKITTKTEARLDELESRADAGSTLFFWLFTWNLLLTAYLVFGWPA